MSEPVYNSFDETGGVGSLTYRHFDLSIVPNELNNVQNVDILNVTGLDGQTLQGGDDSLRIEIILSRADASGSEVITVSPSSTNPIYDRRGNDVSVFLNQKTLNLYDELSPTVSYSPPAHPVIVPNTEYIHTFTADLMNKIKGQKKAHPRMGFFIDI